MTSIPQPPLTELAAAAVQQHELYLAWVSAGFTRAQAMQLLCAIVSASISTATLPPQTP